MDSFSNREEYRRLAIPEGLCRYRVTLDETDLFIATETDLTDLAVRTVRETRKLITEAISREPAFLTSLHPMKVLEDDVPLIRHMKEISSLCHVGPMAAVAGAVAEAAGRELAKHSKTVIIENGGDDFMLSPGSVNVGIYAPGSILSGRLMITVDAAGGTGVCTSSGTYGHSLSFGRAQAAVVISDDTALADAAATRLGNMLKDADRLPGALEEILKIKGVRGAVAVIDDRIGFMGDVTVSDAS